jgi:hypothetical protein
MMKKSFIRSTPGSNVMKLFTEVICRNLEYARVFFSGKPFQPSLMFVNNAEAYLSEALFKCTTLR